MADKFMGSWGLFGPAIFANSIYNGDSTIHPAAETETRMARPSNVLPTLPAMVAGLGAITLSSGELQAAVLGAAARGPGGYLSLMKIGGIALVFFIWVRLADWMNRDTIRIGDLTGHVSQVWNPINLAAQLVGFLAAITIPIFLAGYPLYVLCSFLPWLIYMIVRRSAMKKDSASIQQRLSPEHGLVQEQLEQDRGAVIDFTAAGETEPDRQANLIRARQSPSFATFKDLLADVLLKRADVLLIDYSKTQATPRILVDGTWHPIPPMDRETGDQVLYSLKYVAGLDPAERAARQSGRFALKSPDFGKRNVEVMSQGIPNGERVQIKLVSSGSSKLPLKKLGMLPSMEGPFSEALNKPGICIVSAPPKEGLTTSWQGLLLSADRLTRDCIGMVTEDNAEETSVENIVIKHFQKSDQQEAIVQALLTQPNSIAVPVVESEGAMGALVNGVKNQDMSVWLQVEAKSSVEALLRHMQKAPDRKLFVEGIKHVTNQRLARRLCDDCKQEIRVQPKLIQQLGGDPAKQSTIYRAYRLPPPEQRVDEKGNPIEFPPCKACGGLGHVGRIALFEMLTPNKEVREALIKKPEMKTIDAVATKTRAKIPMSASAYRLVLLGVISLQEAQASLKK